MINSTLHDLRELKCTPESDAVVVIDVLRAFSTAAVAFDRGVVEIYPVLDVADAFERRAREPELVLMGETDCRPIPGFDLGNSPVDAATFPFSGRRAVQRTTAGTRGLVTCSSAGSLWAASFLVASATVAALQASGAKSVAFIITGTVHYGHADEDIACAEWMAERLRGNRLPVEPYLQRVRSSVAAGTFLDPSSELHAPADVDFCARADVFGFALNVVTGPESLVLRRSEVGGL